MEELLLLSSQPESVKTLNSVTHPDSVISAFELHTHSHISTFKASTAPPNAVYADDTFIIAAQHAKPILNVYIWGKESLHQKIILPEPLTTLTVLSASGPLLSASPASPAPPASRDSNLNLQSKLVNPAAAPALLAAGSGSGKLYIWDLQSGDLLSVQQAHYQGVTCVRFTPDGSFLLTGSEDARVLGWSVLALVAEGGSDSLEPEFSWSDHSLAVSAVAVGPSGRSSDSRVYTCSRDRTLGVYDLLTRRRIALVPLPGDPTAMAVDPCERGVYVGLSDGTLRHVQFVAQHRGQIVSTVAEGAILDSESGLSAGKVLRHHENGSVAVTAVALSLDGSVLVSGDSAGRVFSVNAHSGQVIRKISNHRNVGPITNISLVLRHKKVALSVTQGLGSGAGAKTGNSASASSGNVKGAMASLFKSAEKHKLPQLKRVVGASGSIWLQIPTGGAVDIDAWEPEMGSSCGAEVYSTQYSAADMARDLQSIATQDAGSLAADKISFGDAGELEKTAVRVESGTEAVKKLEKELEKSRNGYKELKTLHDRLFLEYMALKKKKN